MSTLVYGGLTLMIGAETASWRRFVVGAAGVFIIATIAISRMVLGAHDVVEVLVGLVIGGTSLALFGHGYIAAQPMGSRVCWLAAASSVIALSLALIDHPAHLELLWHEIAKYLRGATGLCSV